MKKLTLALMCIAALALTACGGGKSGGSASSSESSGNAGGLADGQWPAAIYDLKSRQRARLSIPNSRTMTSRISTASIIKV